MGVGFFLGGIDVEMKVLIIIAVAFAVVAIGVAGLMMVMTMNMKTEVGPGEGEVGQEGEMEEVKEAVQALATEVTALKMEVEADGVGGDEDGGDLGMRLEALEMTVARLKSSFDGAISLEAASAERAEQFLSEDGNEIADKYFEAGKYTIAADGYLKFVQAHPDHPDARNILQRARQAYQKAGYEDMALWVQEEMMRSFPESRPSDLKTLAAMEKEAGRYDSAIEHIAEAADLVPEGEEKIWNRMYWAWYNHLRDGPEAGLAAYEQVQEEIRAAGMGEDHKSATKVQAKIDELRRQVGGE
jgi:tetratricopeptide (TPR) repeat protein